MDMFGMPIMPVGDDGTCKMLSSDRRCTIHADRPLSCRMYGSSSDPRMKCAWGCVPSMVLPPEALAATMEAARSIR